MAGRSALINVMHKASMAASRRMMRDFGEVENLQVTRKGSADFVSQADISAERTIQAELSKARPDWGFIMEEAGQIDAGDKGAPCWIIDPIDGTTNFLHGIPHFAISIAVMDKGKITAGTVFDPARNEFYFAEAGTGAFLNDRRIRVSGRRKMTDCLFSTGIPFLGRGTTETDTLFLAEMKEIMQASSGVRRFGAASLGTASARSTASTVSWIASSIVKYSSERCGQVDASSSATISFWRRTTTQSTLRSSAATTFTTKASNRSHLACSVSRPQPNRESLE